jgi:cytoskeletal protein RodZ
MSSFGDKLKRERELRGISLREIAEGTKISVRFLAALEEDRIDALPGGLFPRAFVRQYALFLGLDAERTVAEFAEAHGEIVPERRPVAPLQASRHRPLPLGHIFLGVIAVLAAAAPSRRPCRARRRSRRRWCCRPTACTRLRRASRAARATA